MKLLFIVKLYVALRLIIYFDFSDVYAILTHKTIKKVKKLLLDLIANLSLYRSEFPKYPC